MLSSYSCHFVVTQYCPLFSKLISRINSSFKSRNLDTHFCMIEHRLLIWLSWLLTNGINQKITQQQKEWFILFSEYWATSSSWTIKKSLTTTSKSIDMNYPKSIKLILQNRTRTMAKFTRSHFNILLKKNKKRIHLITTGYCQMIPYSNLDNTIKTARRITTIWWVKLNIIG